MDANLIFENNFILVFILLMVISFIFVIIGNIVNGEIIISPIKGFVLGALVHDEIYEENKKTFTEYTLQCLLGFISVNVVWRT
jgi:hypothetical protein|tara:strand:+ start:3761 stop:4009 length:249 start_codon:yes stop_codon:yes gene_type:complete